MFNLFNVKINSGHFTVIKLAALIAFAVFTILILTSALTVHAQLSSSFVGPIVECGIGKGPLDCGFCDLQILAQNIINFLIFLAIVVAILMFVYAGFLLVTAGANEGQISRGKSIFWTVFIGLFIILAAWLIIDTVMKTFYKGESSNPQKFGPWNELKCAVIVNSPPPTPIIPPIVVVPPLITKNICYELGFKFLKPTTGGDYIECLPPLCSKTPVALIKGTFSKNSVCSIQCSFVCSDPTSLKAIDPNYVIDPVIVAGPPTILATLKGNGFEFVVSPELGNPVIIDWEATPAKDVQSCDLSGPKIPAGTDTTSIKGNATINLTTVATFSYIFSCTSISVEGLTNTDVATLNVIVKLAPVVTLTANGVANNITVTVGNPVTLKWDTIPQSEFNACTGQGPGFSTGSFKRVEGTDDVTPIIGTFKYSVVCTLNNVAKFGSNKKASVTVEVVP